VHSLEQNTIQNHLMVGTPILGVNPQKYARFSIFGKVCEKWIFGIQNVREALQINFEMSQGHRSGATANIVRRLLRNILLFQCGQPTINKTQV